MQLPIYLLPGAGSRAAAFPEVASYSYKLSAPSYRLLAPVAHVGGRAKRVVRATFPLASRGTRRQHATRLTNGGRHAKYVTLEYVPFPRPPNKAKGRLKYDV